MPPTPDKFMERSVDSLEKIYAVIVALALGQAIQTLVGTPSDVVKNLPSFFSFVALIVPFYHGMNRHLDKCYIEKPDPSTRPALIFDFVVFFILASLFFLFSTSLKSGLHSFVILAVVLAIDSIWALLSHWIHYKGISPSILRWAGLNSAAIVLGVFVALPQTYSEDVKPWLLLAVALVRSFFDYKLCYEFYFPKAGEAAPTNA